MADDGKQAAFKEALELYGMLKKGVTADPSGLADVIRGDLEKAGRDESALDPTGHSSADKMREALSGLVSRIEEANKISGLRQDYASLRQGTLEEDPPLPIVEPNQSLGLSSSRLAVQDMEQLPDATLLSITGQPTTKAAKAALNEAMIANEVTQLRKFVHGLENNEYHTDPKHPHDGRHIIDTYDSGRLVNAVTLLQNDLTGTEDRTASEAVKRAVAIARQADTDSKNFLKNGTPTNGNPEATLAHIDQELVKMQQDFPIQGNKPNTRSL